MRSLKNSFVILIVLLFAGVVNAQCVTICKDDDLKRHLGRGCYVGDNQFLTCGHVAFELDLKKQDYVIKDGKNTYKITSKKYDTNLNTDAALLTVEGEVKCKPVKINYKLPEYSSSVSACGSEKFIGYLVATNTVKLNSQNHVVPGDSGCPVFNIHKELIGFVCAFDTYYENVMYIQQVYFLEKFISGEVKIEKKPVVIMESPEGGWCAICMWFKAQNKDDLPFTVKYETVPDNKREWYPYFYSEGDEVNPFPQDKYISEKNLKEWFNGLVRQSKGD